MSKANRFIPLQRFLLLCTRACMRMASSFHIHKHQVDLYLYSKNPSHLRTRTCNRILKQNILWRDVFTGGKPMVKRVGTKTHYGFKLSYKNITSLTACFVRMRRMEDMVSINTTSDQNRLWFQIRNPICIFAASFCRSSVPKAKFISFSDFRIIDIG